uniref:Spheroidene monooxygenase n=1 Tax=Cereibacter azotoformans TaxID=43057 RepID=G3FHJ0_9RHOB|nr:spheroidene monooxygenase [Cereibacter azotoformans]
MQTVTLSIFRFNEFEKRLWVLGQMTANKLGMHYLPKASFWKMFGSGTGQGFTPKPNWHVWSILAVWPDEETARREVAESPIYQRWGKMADESYTVLLSPTSAWGQWDGKEPFAPVKPSSDVRPIAALTRATIKFWKAERFWAREPAISHMIGKNKDVVFKIGVGEVPFLQQVTFSVWPDSKSMEEFARGAGGPHGEAIKSVRAENWFKEELYARFQILGSIGKWEGKDPVGEALNARPAAAPKPAVEAPKPAPAPVVEKPAPAVEAPKAAPAPVAEKAAVAVEMPKPASAAAAPKPAPVVEAPKPAPAPVASRPQGGKPNFKGKPGKGGRKENA